MGLAPIAAVAVAQQGAAKLAQPVEQALEKAATSLAVTNAATATGTLAANYTSKIWDISVMAGGSFIKGVDGWVRLGG